MDAMPLHPQVIHLPIALALVMPLLAAGLLAAWRTNVLPRRAWLVAVALQALLLGGGIVGLRTGEAEEERVEKVVAERLIEAHEEAAEAFVWGSGTVLLLAIGALAVRTERTARTIALIATAGTLVVLFLAYRTGQAGGELVYRHGAASAYVAADAASQPIGGVNDD
jgi:hypothetical protein